MVHARREEESEEALDRLAIAQRADDVLVILDCSIGGERRVCPAMPHDEFPARRLKTTEVGVDRSIDGSVASTIRASVSMLKLSE
jgi:hypothetical protein